MEQKVDSSDSEDSEVNEVDKHIQNLQEEYINKNKNTLFPLLSQNNDVIQVMAFYDKWFVVKKVHRKAEEDFDQFHLKQWEKPKMAQPEKTEEQKKRIVHRQRSKLRNHEKGADKDKGYNFKRIKSNVEKDHKREQMDKDNSQRVLVELIDENG